MQKKYRKIHFKPNNVERIVLDNGAIVLAYNTKQMRMPLTVYGRYQTTMMEELREKHRLFYNAKYKVDE